MQKTLKENKETEKVNKVVDRVLKTVVALTVKNGGNFVSVQNYTNQQGEISNQLFNCNINYRKLLQDDLKAIENVEMSKLIGQKGIDVSIFETAQSELVLALEKLLMPEDEKQKLREQGDATILRSDAQKKSYTSVVGNALKIKDSILYVYGLRTSKTIVKAIEYKTVNSRDKTIAKQLIKKLADTKGHRFRMFKLGHTETLKTKGFTI